MLLIDELMFIMIHTVDKRFIYCVGYSRAVTSLHITLCLLTKRTSRLVDGSSLTGSQLDCLVGTHDC